MRGVLWPLLVCVFLGPPAWARARAIQKLVPANFAHKTDSMGFRWDIQRTGIINDGTSDCFDNGAALMVNGQPFNATSAMMTADGQELVLKANIRGLEVTRRIKVDVKACGARYIEVFKNTGRGSQTVAVGLRSYLGGSCQTVVSETGGFTPMALGKKDSGVLAVQHPQTQRPSVLFCLAGSRSKVKPALAISSNRTFQFNYSLAVPAGKTVSLLHTVAQRRVGAPPDAKTLATMFQPFKSRKWVRDVPSAVRRTIVNMRGFVGVSGAAPELLTTLEQLGIERANTDILAFGEETRVRGTAACAQLSIKTRYGTMTIPFEKVAAVVGSKVTGRYAQVFLRDGQVLSGKAEVRGLRFTMNSGLSVDLSLEALDRLALRAKADDGKPPPTVHAFVDTFEGHRLAVLRDPALRVGVTTPWGSLEIPLAEVRWLSMPEDGTPGHLIRLRDGSRFFGFLDGAALPMKTLLFGVQKFAPTEIRTIAAVEHKRAKEEDGEIDQPHVVLAGDNVVVGRLDLAELHFLSAGQVIPVPPSQVRVLHNLAEEEGEAAGGGPTFHAEMWGGGTVRGQLREIVLPVRIGDRVCQVPARDIADVYVPSPTVPERLRDKVAALIRDLGHPEWEKRDAASRQLAELGFVAKQQLEEALKQTTDPEVRRRVKDLLDGMGE